jgi:hypothetical protein
LYIPGISALFEAFQFHHLVPHSPQDPSKASPFQGFAPGLLESAPIFARIARLPRSAAELFIDRDGVMAHRVAYGRYNVVPMQWEVLRPYLKKADPGFCCVWSISPETAEAVRAVIEEHRHPILHATPESTGFGIPIEQVDRDALRRYTVAVLEHWEATGTGPAPAEVLRASIDTPSETWDEPLPLAQRGHLIVAPNEAALAAVGFTLLGPEQEPLVASDNEPYFEAIRVSVKAIRDARERVFAASPHLRWGVPYDTILTAPSMYKAASDYRKGRRSGTFPEPTLRVLEDTLRLLTRQRGTYSSSTDGRSMQKILESPEAGALIQARQDELYAYTSVLSLAGSGNLVPVIRLPPHVNNTRQELLHLSTAASRQTPHRARKLSDLARKLSSKLTEGIPEWVTEEIRDSTSVKLISDVPLEWLSMDSMPLSMRVDCSRIPATPGDLLFLHGVAVPEIVLPPSAFDEVLIVRSFHPDDPIRDRLTSGVDRMAEGGKLPRIRYVDVATRAELITALETFTGALMIYDGHGAHDPHSDYGTLSLAEEDVETWTLRGEARIPPIVVLSACDTHPFNGSHLTSANGLLTAGARTVLGTSLPVDATYSAIFIARLLLRIGKYAPILLNRPWGSLRWSEIVPGLQRRMHTNEAIWAINGKDGIRLDNEAQLRITFDVGMAIDTGNEAWHDVMVQSIANEANVPELRVRNALRREAYLTDALLYVQLGNPERIIIAKSYDDYRKSAETGLDAGKGHRPQGVIAFSSHTY